MSTLTPVTEYQPEGNLHPIRVGDVVRVLPSRPHKRDGYRTKVVAIRVDAAGQVAELDVHDTKGSMRTVRPGRVAWLDQTTPAPQRKGRKKR